MGEKIYDLAIVGGGPAGVTAGIYAARKRMQTVLITDSFGGQSVVSDDIQNWIGYAHISGMDLANKLEEHLREYAGNSVDINYPQRAVEIKKEEKLFTIITENESQYKSKNLFIATGSVRRKLPAKNADLFEHKGLTYCASCDGPLFADKDVVVVGGGNAGFETAAQLLAYVKTVTLLQFGDKFTADEVTVERLQKNKNFTALKNVEVLEVLGDKFVSGIKYKDRTTNQEKVMDAQGIFVEIGMKPNTDLVKNIVSLDDYNRITVDPKTQHTGVPGIWAAGDCTDVLYHQNGIAVGDAIKALENIYATLHAS